MALSSLNETTQQKLVSQYYDDWYATSNTPGLTRGQEFDFHRILFRPRYGVQSRELTQLQTSLQSQLQHLSGATLTYGQAVKDAQIAYLNTVTSGKVTPATNVAAFFNRSTNIGELVYKSGDENTKAKVLQFIGADEGITPDSYLILKYEQDNPFVPGDTVLGTGDISAIFASDVDAFSTASIFSVTEGVFYVAGFFVRCAPQTIVLDAFSSTPSCVVGLTVNEEFLDELDEVVGETLLDPANQNAVGAHRLRLRLVLTSYGLSVPLPQNFIALATIINGVLQQNSVQQQRYVTMKELLAILARRTYDESGDYVLRPFVPVIEADPNSSDHFRVTLGPGKAYVHGWEIEKSTPSYVTLRKGRETDARTQNNLGLEVGNHAYVLRVATPAPYTYFGQSATVDIHCIPVSNLDVSSAATYNRSRIGQTKVRLVETDRWPDSPANLANNTVQKLYFYDTTFDTLTGNVAVTGVTDANGGIQFALAVANGVPLINGAINGATIVLGGASSPISGTFTVNNYSANATHANVQLREYLPTYPTTNTTYKLLFQPKDIDGFALFDGATAYASIFKSNLSFQAEVSVSPGKEGNNPFGPTQIDGAVNSTVLYELPDKFVVANTMTVGTAVFDTWVQASACSVAMVANGATVTLGVTDSWMTLPLGALSADGAKNLLVVFDCTADSSGRGEFVGFADGAASTVRCLSNCVISGSTGNYTISFYYNHGASGGGTRTFRAMARATSKGLPVRSKTLMLGNTGAVISGSANALFNGQVEYYSLNAVAGFSYNLHAHDVLRLVKVLFKASNVAFQTSDLVGATDVTDLFTLDSGQRDNSYEYARAVCTKLASQTIKPDGRLLFIFDWLYNDGQGYATVDSYLSALNQVTQQAALTANVNFDLSRFLTYDSVPSYTSTKTGSAISLRDVLDFRPAVSVTAAQTAVSLIFSSNTAIANTNGQSALTNTVYLTSGAKPYLLPAGQTEWLGDYQFYLGRVDEIGLSYDGNFKVNEGQDAKDPKNPTETGDALLLYRVAVPPYTLVDANGKPTTTVLSSYDYKRYTMKDIGKVDGRVTHLEYYTALNSLERITKEQSILDQNGNERFKNGFVVDSFNDTTVGDVANRDFTASIDQLNRELRTGFRTTNMQFSPDVYGSITGSTTQGITLIGDMAIPNFTTGEFIKQPYATHAISVNPFDIGTFYGTMKLNPAVDIWKSTLTLPAQTIDMGGPTDAWVKSQFPAYTVWGEWSQTWSGVVSRSPKSQTTYPDGWTPWDHPWRSETITTWDDVTTQTNYARQGTTYEYGVESTTRSLGNRIVDTSIIHNCRARDVVFSASGMKPGSPLYAFFDGVNVDKYIQAANIIEVESLEQAAAPTFYIGQTLYVKKQLTGTANIVNLSPIIRGNGTYYDFELSTGQLVEVVKGVDSGLFWVSATTNGTYGTLASGATFTANQCTLYAWTPVTVCEVSPRYSGTTVAYTLKVARARRIGGADQGVPYEPWAGPVGYKKVVNNLAGSDGAILIVPASSIAGATKTANLAAKSSKCVSGICRYNNSGTGQFRFDLDITDSEVSNPGTIVRIVSGPGAGQSAAVVSYDSATQTAVLDAALSAVAGQSIYSVGRLKADGFIDQDPTQVAGRAGYAAGVFHLPEGVFATGTRQFRLTDEATNTVAEAKTAAETNYEASGLAVTQQETSVTTRNMVLQRRGVTVETSGSSVTTKENVQVSYYDPLAETFLVDAKQYPQGVMLSSVDLWFASVPDRDVPVIVEVRGVVNGYPSSSDILPCPGGGGLAQVIKTRDEVTVAVLPSATSTPATHTRFTFPALVHLMPGREYAIVVRSDSDDYTVWTAELGGTLIGTTDTKVTKQPYAGSFFKSQNASTWTESPYEDLMFRLNKAVWTGSLAAPQTALLVGRAVPPAVNTVVDSVTFYPHDAQFSDQTTTRYEFDLKPMNAATGDLTAQVAVRYTAYPEEWVPLSVRSMVQGYGDNRDYVSDLLLRPVPVVSNNILGSANTVDLLAYLTTYSADVAPYIDLAKINILGITHDINDMGLQADDFQISNPGAGYLVTQRADTVDCTNGTPTITVHTGGSVSFLTLIQPGDRVCLGGNLEVTVLSVTNSSQFVATANVAENRSANTWFTYGGDVSNTNSQFVTLTVTSDFGAGATANAHVSRQGKVDYVVVTANGAGYTDTPLVAVPVPGAVGGFTVAQTPAVLSYLSELAPKQGNGLTRYLTFPVTLADGFDARDIKVYFDAYRPAGSKFYVYYRVLPVNNETDRFEDQPWRMMTQVTSNTTISTRWNMFKEFEFRTPNERALDATGDTTDKFRTFAIKIVMAVENPVNAPRIANFRAIALDD